MALFDDLPPPKNKQTENPLKTFQLNKDDKLTNSNPVQESVLKKPKLEKSQDFDSDFDLFSEKIDSKTNNQDNNNIKASSNKQEITSKYTIPPNLKQVKSKTTETKNSASGFKVPAAWTSINIDEVPVEQEKKIINTRDTANIRKFDLSEYLPQKHKIQSYSSFIPAIKQSKGGYKFKNSHNPNKFGFFGESNTLLHSFDENELYNPAVPNLYQHLKAWEAENKKQKLQEYMRSLKTQNKNNSNAFTQNSKESTSNHQPHDTEDPYQKSGYSSDSTVNECPLDTSNNSTISNNVCLSNDSNNNTIPNYQDHIARHTNDAQKDNTDRKATKPLTTGEDAYQARLRLSQQLSNPTKTNPNISGDNNQNTR
ncbi:hypothetical protein BB559_006295 [Furculomyces boomerangus]|uniref:Uncharacterized protein n=1 Tax=Furculomyces boomerangus TaxID=61424 RepID=A0A2T9Y3T8_9FUNG|nr:hypothetical protein BB559_006295 [Furculomyces boomerangus]